MAAFNTLRGIAWQMTPSWDHAIKCALRMFMGSGLIFGASMLPEAIAPWSTFGGKLFIMLGVIGLFGHAEGVFASHVSAKVRKESERLAVVGAVALALCTIWARNKCEDESGMG